MGYRLVLKLDNFFVAAPLGLARIFGQIEQKSKLCDKHYTESIKICKQKLIKLYEKYEFELKQQIKDQKEENMQKEKMNKELHQNRIAKHSNSINLNIERDEELKNDSQQIENEQEDMDEEEEEEIKLITSCDSNAATPTDKKKKIKFSDKFKITLKEIDNILSADQDFNISLIRIVKELRQYMLYCIDAHLGKIELIIQSLHNNKWREALSHCVRVLYLDNNNITAMCKKSLLYFKLNQKEKAMFSAKAALKLAEEYDERNEDKKTNKQSIVKNELYMVFKLDKQSVAKSPKMNSCSISPL